QRAEMLAELAVLRAQLVFYESPQRVGRTLGELQAALGDRQALVAREMTKMHEELARGMLSELERKVAGDVRGEGVIVGRGAPGGTGGGPRGSRNARGGSEAPPGQRREPEVHRGSPLGEALEAGGVSARARAEGLEAQGERARHAPEERRFGAEAAARLVQAE